MVTATPSSPWKVRRDASELRGAKKEALLHAAARLFARQGFHATSLDDIAASLQVTKPTLYHYVDGKEPLLFACMERGLTLLCDGLQRVAAEDLPGRERLRKVMSLYAATATSDFGLCAIRVGEEPLNPARRRAVRDLKTQVEAAFRTLIAQGMDDGWIVPADAATAAISVVGALNGIGRWYQPDTHTADSLADAVRHCIEMLMHGVLDAPPQPGAAVRATPAAPAPGRADIRREPHFGPRVMQCFAQRPTSVSQMLADTLRQRPEAEALVHGDLRLSWRELHHAATKCAAGLARRGVQPGDRVALYLGNVPELVFGLLGCAWLGAVSVPIGVRAGAAEVAFTLADAGAVAVICAEERAAQLPAAADAPELRCRITLGRRADEGFETFAALMAAPPLEQPQPGTDEDVAVLLYTSGTTGRPKGSMVTQLNIAHSAMHFAQATALAPEHRVAVAVPAVHATGLIAQLFTSLYVGCAVVLMGPFKAADFLRLVARERITHTIMVPAMYNLLLLQPDLQQHDLSSWRVGAYGGAPMPTPTIDELATRLPGLTLMNAYGATETSSPATIMPAGQTPAHRDSVGLPVTCGELYIADEQGREVPRGEVGEIWVAGPMVVPGYWRNPEATASEFHGGFWRSGDIGSQDADGYVRILDRRKDVINRGGYKIYGIACENALAEHPQVVESALVGAPCPVLGERVHAFVCVRATDDSTTPAALAAFCAQRVSDYSVPETWTIGTEPLPRNANGKIMKRQLRQSLHAVLS